jgi:acetoin utilization deacetylase AcuC-like enzyme
MDTTTDTVTGTVTDTKPGESYKMYFNDGTGVPVPERGLEQPSVVYPMRPQDISPQWFAQGGARSVSLHYDAAHSQHNPYDLMSHEAALLRGVETPIGVHKAYASMIYAGCFTTSVSHAPAKAPREKYDQSEAVDALRFAHERFMLGALPDKVDPRLSAYVCPATQRVTDNVAQMCVDAVDTVCTSPTDGAVVLSRPVGSSVDVDKPVPRVFATYNSAARAMRQALTHVDRVGIVSVQTRFPAGLAAAARAASTGNQRVFLASIHASRYIEQFDGTMDEEGVELGSPSTCGNAVLSIAFSRRGTNHDTVKFASDTLVLPAMTAFQPDLLLFVFGDQNPCTTPYTAVQMDTSPRTWAACVQSLLPVQPKAVVMTEALLRTNKCAAAMACVLSVMAGRGFQTSAIKTIIATSHKNDLDRARQAYIAATSKEDPVYATVSKSISPQAAQAGAAVAPTT